MKKITSLLLTAILLATMLTVFAVPASAARGPNYVGKWVSIENAGALGTVTGEHIYCFAYERGNTFNAYKIAIYKVGMDNIIIGKSTFEEFVVGEVPTSLIPQVALAEAANDYPDLFPDSSIPTEDGEGSILSEGSLTIIVGIAAAVVFGLGGFFVGKAAGKKKNPALASGENKDEE